MDPWDHYWYVRAPKRESIERWAELEGKSATTRDDLYRAQLPERNPSFRLLSLAAWLRIAATLLNFWISDKR